MAELNDSEVRGKSGLSTLNVNWKHASLVSSALELADLVRGFGFLLVVAVVVAYAVGSYPLPERSSGEITVKTTPPGATIFVDGTHRGSSPLRVSGLRPGTHQLRAFLPGYKGMVLRVEVLPSANDSLDWMLEPSVPDTRYRQLTLYRELTLVLPGNFADMFGYSWKG